MKSSATKYPSLMPSRDVNPQQWQYLEKIYSNYEEISAQQEEIAARKCELDVEFVRANKDEIDAIIYSGEGRDLSQLGDFETYDRVQYVLKNFVYARSRDMRQIAEAELALKDRLAFYTDTCAEQKERIESLETSLSAVQNELAELMDIMRLKEKEFSKTTDASAVKTLRIAQLERECDNLRNLSDMDERAICRDFRLLVKANKKLEQENVRLRAAACANPSLNINAVSTLLESNSFSPWTHEGKKKKKLDAKQAAHEEGIVADELKSGIKETEVGSGKSKLAEECVSPMPHPILPGSEAKEGGKSVLSASLRKGNKQRKGSKSQKGTDKAKPKGSTSKSSKAEKTGAESKQEKGYPAVGDGGGEVPVPFRPGDKTETRESKNLNVNSHTALRHEEDMSSNSPGMAYLGGKSQLAGLESSNDKSMSEDDDYDEDTDSSSSKLMNEEERALYLSKEAPLTALMRKMQKEREMWLRHSEFSERTAFANLDYDANWVYQSQFKVETVDAATNTEELEELYKSESLDLLEAKTDLSWEMDSRSYGDREESVDRHTSDMESASSVGERKAKGLKKVSVISIRSASDSPKARSDRDRSLSSGSFTTNVEIHKRSSLDKAHKQNDGRIAGATYDVKRGKTTTGLVSTVQGEKESFYAGSSKNRTHLVKFEDEFVEPSSSLKRSSMRAAEGGLVEKRESRKKKPLPKDLSSELLERHKEGSISSGTVAEEALRILNLLHSARNETAAVSQSHRILQADMDGYFSILGSALEALSSGNALEFMQNIENEREAFEAQVTEGVIGDLVEQRVFDRLAEEGIVLQRHQGHSSNLTDEQWAENKLYDAIAKYSREDIAGDIMKDVQQSEKDLVAQGSDEPLPGNAKGKRGLKHSRTPRGAKTRTSPKSSAAAFHGANRAKEAIERTSKEEAHHSDDKSELLSPEDEDTWERFASDDAMDEGQGLYGQKGKYGDDGNEDKAPEALWVAESASWTSLGVGGSTSFWGVGATAQQQDDERSSTDLPHNVRPTDRLKIRGRTVGLTQVRQGACPREPPCELFPELWDRLTPGRWSSLVGEGSEGDRPSSATAGAAGARDKGNLLPGRLVRQFAGGRGGWTRNLNTVQPVPIELPPLEINGHAPNNVAIPPPPRFNHNILEYLRSLRPRVHIPDLNMAPVVYRYDFGSALERLRERVQRSVGMALNNLDGPEFENRFAEHIVPYARAAKLIQEGREIMPWATRAIRDLRMEEEKRQHRRSRVLFSRVVTNMRAGNLLRHHLCRGSALASFVIVLWKKWKMQCREEDFSRRNESVKVLKRIVKLLSEQQHTQHRAPQKQKVSEKPPAERNHTADPSSKHFSEARFPQQKEKQL